MLFIRQVKHLARILDTSSEHLRTVLEDTDANFEDLILRDPAKVEEHREVVCVKGAIRKFQSKLYRRLLLKALTRSPYSYSYSGRNIKKNAEAHQRSAFVFKTDISDFYPTVHHSRIYRLFVNEFRCSPDVARICTRLCSYRFHLALGLITSPILAEQILHRVDSRIGAACHNAGLVYTRYVDDVTISGPYNLEKSGFQRIVTEILCEDGFHVNSDKNKFAEMSKRTSITSIRVVQGRLDVRKEYADELERQIDDARRLAIGGPFVGPYYTEGQIRGRMQFVCWVNPRRRRHLLKRFNSVSWPNVADAARELGLVVTKKTLHKPDQRIPAGAK